jgi:hypothetical protein
MTLAEIMAKAEAQDEMMKKNHEVTPKKRKAEQQKSAVEMNVWGDVPDNVKRYIVKCFGVCAGDMEKQRMMVGKKLD